MERNDQSVDLQFACIRNVKELVSFPWAESGPSSALRRSGTDAGLSVCFYDPETGVTTPVLFVVERADHLDSYGIKEIGVENLPGMAPGYTTQIRGWSLRRGTFLYVMDSTELAPTEEGSEESEMSDKYISKVSCWVTNEAGNLVQQFGSRGEPSQLVTSLLFGVSALGATHIPLSAVQGFTNLADLDPQRAGLKAVGNALDAKTCLDYRPSVVVGLRGSTLVVQSPPKEEALFLKGDLKCYSLIALIGVEAISTYFRFRSDELETQHLLKQSEVLLGNCLSTVLEFQTLDGQDIPESRNNPASPHNSLCSIGSAFKLFSSSYTDPRPEELVEGLAAFKERVQEDPLAELTFAIRNPSRQTSRLTVSFASRFFSDAKTVLRKIRSFQETKVSLTFAEAVVASSPGIDSRRTLRKKQEERVQRPKQEKRSQVPEAARARKSSTQSSSTHAEAGRRGPKGRRSGISTSH